MISTSLTRLSLACLVAVAACSSDAPEPLPPLDSPDVSPAEHKLPRLTEVQYRNAVSDIFGSEIVVPARLEPDTPIEGMVAIGSSRTSISALGVERFESAAYQIAEQVMEPGATRDRLVPCSPVGVTDDACARSVITTLGRRIWRRPLVTEEIDALTSLVNTAATRLGDFYDGLEFAIAALLQSPNFLFRSELGEPDPFNPDRLRYNNYEMASRLSFFVWNTTPDDELLDAAERGELIGDDGLRAQADRLLQSDRARAGVRAFFTDMFRLDELDHLSKDPTVFVHMSEEVGPAAREETLRLIENLIFDLKGDYRELFTTKRTFIDRRLAAIYETRAPAREGFAETVWAQEEPRAGILTHISILALNSHPVASSATLRGKFIRRTLLCGVILPPPTDLNTAIPEPSPEARTMRERLIAHQEDEFCATCHKAMDPIGYGLEQYDALGRYRILDNGAVIDPSGDIDGEVFSGPIALGQAIAEHPNVPRCLVKHMYRYASSREDEPGERDLIDYMTEKFARADYRVLDLMVDVAMSEGFRVAVKAKNPPKGGE